MMFSPMAGALKTDPEIEVYGDLEVTEDAVAEVGPAGPANDDLEKAGFIGSIMLGLFTLSRIMDLMAENRYVAHRIIGTKFYSITPALIAYSLLGAFFLVGSPWFSRMFVNRGALGVGRLVVACVGWMLILLSIVPVTTAVTGFPPVGYASNFFADISEPLVSAYGPAGVGLALIFGARLAPLFRIA